MKESRCVRVTREQGEEVRQLLLERGAVDQDLEIRSEEDYLLIPVTDMADLPPELEVQREEFEPRETHTSPEDILGWQPSFEVIGSVALIEEEDPQHRKEVASAVLEADNNVRTVLNVESKVRGRERTRELQHVAGEPRSEVVHREYGNEFVVDLRDVYFSPRLANERQRVAEQVQEGETVFDMFAGAGPFSIPAAKKGARVIAVDVNPSATEYLRENAERNGVADLIQIITADVRDVAPGAEADRIIMNLPHTADEFLDSAMEAARGGAVVHYYDIRHEDDLFGGAVEEIGRVAGEHGYGVEVLEEVVVRSYAPREYNVCVDFRVREP